MGYSMRFVKDEYIAEEVVGDVMFKLWNERTRFESIKDIKPYLYQMVRNASIDHIRKNQKIHSLDPDFDTGDSEDFDFDFLEEEVHSVLIQALQNLPEKCRRVFEHSCLEGMKYKEIAELMEISVNTVKSQRTRAIELLQNQLRNHPLIVLILAFL
ncbi:hypothetical protein DMZ48_17835 [Robertkochia solimangrovi]|nr:hypothetical protein DMZ48_17835 [Robertkochia solimangrovi]